MWNITLQKVVDSNQPVCLTQLPRSHALQTHNTIKFSFEKQIVKKIPNGSQRNSHTLALSSRSDIPATIVERNFSLPKLVNLVFYKFQLCRSKSRPAWSKSPDAALKDNVQGCSRFRLTSVGLISRNRVCLRSQWFAFQISYNIYINIILYKMC